MQKVCVLWGRITVLVPWGHPHCATDTAQAVLDDALPGAGRRSGNESRRGS